MIFSRVILWSIAVGTGCGHLAVAEPGDARAAGQAVEKVFISQFNRAVIVPSQMRTFMMPAAGGVSNWLPETGILEKDAIIATINEKEVELDARETELKIDREKQSKKEELIKLENQLDEVTHYLKMDAEARKWSEKDPGLYSRDIQESVKDKISLLNRDLELFEAKTRQELKKKQDAYILKMPYKGKIQYQFSLPNDDAQSVYLDAGSPVVSVYDDSSYYITISLSNPDLIRMDPDLLSAGIVLGNGESISGSFAYKKVEKTASSSGGDSLVYFFKLDPKDHLRAHKMLGALCVAKLFFTPSEPVIFVNKVALSLRDEARNCATWSQALQAVYPEYELIIEAESQLVVKKR